ncbi:MAG: adenylosuccinate lyase [Gemmatimonadetes bacterium]|nr:adenylosuccinate lyase [Gemmatimonadota bacterium]
MALHAGAGHPLASAGRTLVSRAPSDRYVHALTERYASPEMLRIFSPARRYGAWRRLWLALAETQQELGLAVSDEAIGQMHDHLDDIDLDRAAAYERRFRHDVMAHVHLFGDVAPAARAIIHLGATSSYVTDNADLILHREALALIRERLIRCIAVLARFAATHRALPTLAYTHFQPAQPTTVGKRASLWIQDLVLDLEELEFRRATLRFHGVRGATGTQASFLELFDGDAERVERLDEGVARRMGFEASFAVSAQTYPRKVDAALLATLGGIAMSASKFGHDMRLLQHTGEVQEPFAEDQVGSSVMPYKQNPMRAERICSLARHLITLGPGQAFTAATQWLERTLDDSAIRRMEIPDAYLTADAILVLLENVAAGLTVNPTVIRRNLEAQLPFMATEAVLMRATARGGDRQALHERLRRHSLAAAARMREDGTNDLLERIAGDPAFALGRAELDQLLDPGRFIGLAREQVDRFLHEHVDPVIGELDEGVLGELERVAEPGV